jgi:Protein of unknown function (DUF998)
MIQPVLSSSKKSTFLRICAWAGIIGPILFVLVFTLDGFLQPGYSTLTQMVSWLALRSNGWIQNSNFLVFGLLLILFAIGFFQRMRSVISSKWLLASTLLLLISGTGWANEYFAVSDAPGTTHATFHGIMHVVGFLVIFLSLMVVFFIIGRQLLKISVWRKYGWYTMIASFATLGIFLLLIFLSTGMPQITGLLNRLLIVEATAWYVVMGWRFLALENTQTEVI